MEDFSKANTENILKTKLPVWLPIMVGSLTATAAFALLWLIDLDLLPAICTAAAIGVIAALLLPERYRATAEG